MPFIFSGLRKAIIMKFWKVLPRKYIWHLAFSIEIWLVRPAWVRGGDRGLSKLLIVTLWSQKARVTVTVLHSMLRESECSGYNKRWPKDC